MFVNNFTFPYCFPPCVWILDDYLTLLFPGFDSGVCLMGSQSQSLRGILELLLLLHLAPNLTLFTTFYRKADPFFF